MRTLKRVLAILALTASAIVANAPASEQPTPKLRQFVYVLKVTPAFHDESKWTQKENEAVARHFERLTEATKTGRVIFAGKTSEALDKTFGLVVFEAEDESVARQFMESDPAVVAGVMSATLHPYVLALQRKR